MCVALLHSEGLLVVITAGRHAGKTNGCLRIVTLCPGFEKRASERFKLF